MWGRFTKSGLQLESSASRTTTHRRMQDMGFSCPHSLCQATLEHRQRQKRLAWAKDKKDWTAADGSKVMFSDGSKFCISFGNQVPESGGREERHMNPRCLRSSVKFPHSVMVWDAMSSAGVGSTVFSEVHRSTQPYTRKF